MSRRDKRDTANRYELIACAFEGHALVGTDVAVIEDEDALVVREHDGLRWYRCLRCDAWLPRRPPAEPSRDRLPGREEIEVPLRGPALRDRYVLRLIAVEEFTEQPALQQREAIPVGPGIDGLRP